MPLTRRIPKCGFTNPFREEYQVVNVGLLEERFDAGSTVDAATLYERGVLHSKHAPVKLLGNGDLTKSLKIARGRCEREREPEGAAPAVPSSSRPTARRARALRSRIRRRPRPTEPAGSETPARGADQAMFKKLNDMFKIPELKRRILFTIALLDRLPARQPHPHAGGQTWLRSPSSSRAAAAGCSGLYDMFVGGNLANATIFALGIMPYISASIIFQLLQAGGPVLREAGEGRRGGPPEDHPVHALRHGAAWR